MLGFYVHVCDNMLSAKEVDDAIEKFLVEFNATMQQMNLREFKNLVSMFVKINKSKMPVIEFHKLFKLPFRM